MKARRTFRALLTATLVFALVGLPAAPAIAAPEPTIKAGVRVRMLDLGGLTESAAIATLTANPPVAGFSAMPVEADGHTWWLTAGDYVALDVTATVAAALDAPADSDLNGVYLISGPAISTFVEGAATVVDVAAVDSRRVVSRRKLTITAPASGLALDKAAAVTAITNGFAALREDTPGIVRLPLSVVSPRVTPANIGKTIIVIRGKYKVVLYNGPSVEKSYGCAVGMRAYPTPLGTFRVTKKAKRPTWVNPFSSWSRKMPSHIHGGAGNPLGLRALYISAPGIRIHGTSQTRSIGHRASHGCIRLTNKNIVKLYPRVPVGTPVYIVK